MKARSLFTLLFLTLSVFASKADTLRIIFIGDIMQHTAQIESARKASAAGIKKNYDYTGCFRHIHKRFSQADVVVANMETTFAGAPYTGYPSFSSPPSLLTDANNSGIDVFLAANNHICDKGERGLKKTIDLYDSLKIQYTGIYRNREEQIAKKTLIITGKDFRIALLNYTYGTNGIPVNASYQVNFTDTSAMAEDLERSGTLGCDLVVVCIHWGTEYNLKFSPSQEKIAKFLLSKGVNVIIGSHPHVPQPVAVSVGGDGEIKSVVYYSLGNAISNMTAPYTRIGLMAEISVTRDSSDKAVLLPPSTEYIWTSRPGTIDDSFSILPVSTFSEKPSLFRSRAEYDKMMYYYLQLKK